MMHPLVTGTKLTLVLQVLASMSSLARHPFGWHYIYLRLFAILLRSLTTLSRWMNIGSQKSNNKIPEGVTVKKITVPSRDKGRNISVHLYQPPGYDGTKPTPVLVNLHGSVKLSAQLDAVSAHYYPLQLRIRYPASGHKSRVLQPCGHQHAMCSS